MRSFSPRTHPDEKGKQFLARLELEKRAEQLRDFIGPRRRLVAAEACDGDRVSDQGPAIVQAKITPQQNKQLAVVASAEEPVRAPADDAADELFRSCSCPSSSYAGGNHGLGKARGSAPGPGNHAKRLQETRAFTNRHRRAHRAACATSWPGKLPWRSMAPLSPRLRARERFASLPSEAPTLFSTGSQQWIMRNRPRLEDFSSLHEEIDHKRRLSDFSSPCAIEASSECFCVLLQLKQSGIPVSVRSISPSLKRWIPGSRTKRSTTFIIFPAPRS